LGDIRLTDPALIPGLMPPPVWAGERPALLTTIVVEVILFMHEGLKKN
jgi:hypothetical protein